MSTVTRRSLLLGGLAAVCGGAVATDHLGRRPGPRNGDRPAVRQAVESSVRPPHLQRLLRSHFTPAVGSALLATRPGGAHRLRLVSVTDVSRARLPERQFNLLFQPLGLDRLDEGIYEISGARVPDSTLFLSPVGPAGKNRRLQALVNSPT